MTIHIVKLLDFERVEHADKDEVKLSIREQRASTHAFIQLATFSEIMEEPGAEDSS
jgi:hypothetical protein